MNQAIGSSYTRFLKLYTVHPYDPGMVFDDSFDNLGYDNKNRAMYLTTIMYVDLFIDTPLAWFVTTTPC